MCLTSRRCRFGCAGVSSGSFEDSKRFFRVQGIRGFFFFLHREESFERFDVGRFFLFFIEILIESFREQSFFMNAVDFYFFPFTQPVFEYFSLKSSLQQNKFQRELRVNNP